MHKKPLIRFLKSKKNKITVVTYDNGVKVYLNYGDTAAQADGYTIEAMSYKVVE